MRRHLLALVKRALIKYLGADVGLHGCLALATRDAEQRLLVPLSNTINNRLPLILQRDRVIIIPIRILRIHQHLPRAALLRRDLKRLLLRIRIVALILISWQNRLRQSSHILQIL